MERVCAECGQYVDSDNYSNNQWRKGEGYSRCADCVSGNGHHITINAMGRVCAECGQYLDSDNYSNNQWRKGEGYSRCADCVSGNEYEGFDCELCDRSFSSRNALEMHQQVHRPLDYACPVCGDKRFKSGANAVQHVESGYCRGCLGRENARHQIYKYVSSKPQMQPYLANNQLLEYDGGRNSSEVPEFPYICDYCDKRFRQLSQQMQHQDQKHGVRTNEFRITY